MATDEQFDLVPPTWDLLPLHPPPEPLESFTSYITRIAERNGFQLIDDLANLAGRPNGWKNQYLFPDFPCPPYEGLARITGCSVAQLEGTTFSSLREFFGFRLYPTFFRKFLQESLAADFRYCPICLAEQPSPYASLIRRFLFVPGCLLHHCAFLNQCGHCGALLPLLARFPWRLRCLSCLGDLRACQSRYLSDEEVRMTQRRTDDLTMLLTLRPGSGISIVGLGERFAFLRQNAQLSWEEVARLMGIRDEGVVTIEGGYLRGEANLEDYLRYAEALGFSLRDIFAVKLPQRSPLSLRAEREKNGLKYTATAHQLKEQAKHKQEHRRPGRDGEKERLQRMKRTFKQLSYLGKPITQQRVRATIGKPRSWFMQYPRVKALLESLEEK